MRLKKSTVLLVCSLVAGACSASGEVADSVSDPAVTTLVGSLETGDTPTATVAPSTAVPLLPTSTLLSEPIDDAPDDLDSGEALEPAEVKEWFPGVYLPRHCGLSGTEFVDLTDISGEEYGCRADLMMEWGVTGDVGRDESTSTEVFGISQYLRVFEIYERYPDTGQFGTWGQWMQSDGAHPNGAFNSIEGGLFVNDKMGRSRFPKYMASAATHLYSPDSDTAGGWGFWERRIDCSLMGRLTLSNRMMVPPNLIAFDENQNTYDDEGGIYVGTSWVALPLIGGAERHEGQARSTENGLLTWTFVIDAANYSGPLIAYAPQHWFRRSDRWSAFEVLDAYWEEYVEEDNAELLDSPVGLALADFVHGDLSEEELHAAIENEEWYESSQDNWEPGDMNWIKPENTLGFAPAQGYVPVGVEMPPIPSFMVEQDGRTFIKIFPPQLPNVSENEGYALNVQTFDVDIYNKFLDVFSFGADLSAVDTSFNGLGNPMQVHGWEVEYSGDSWREIEVGSLEQLEDPYESNIDLHVPSGGSQVNDETNVLIEWGSVDADQRGWSTYYEMVDGAAVPVEASEVPAELLELEYETRQYPASIASHDEDVGLDFSCWTCDDSASCDDTVHVAVLDDDSRVSYQWYRFADQPAFKSLKEEYPEFYSMAAMNDLQATIESMHRDWGSTQEFLEQPTSIEQLHLAEVDHGLLVEPPDGKEVGWVPIVTQVELPDGEWQEEVDFRESMFGITIR